MTLTKKNQSDCLEPQTVRSGTDLFDLARRHSPAAQIAAERGRFSGGSKAKQYVGGLDLSVGMREQQSVGHQPLGGRVDPP
jgi:hypothetical protein